MLPVPIRPSKFESPNADTRSALINTPLQWGAEGREEFDNRFNGFSSAKQTVETVKFPLLSPGTPLKWGVNEMSSNPPHSAMRPSRLAAQAVIASCSKA